MSKKDLSVSEDFYSVQGEGPTMGAPAIFLRLKGCNLTCGGINTVQTKLLDSGATWRCDTIETWLQGESVSNAAILSDWSTKGYLEAFKKGAHLVVTGGEPLLQQLQLVSFFEDLEIVLEGLPYIEVETNATFEPKEELLDFVAQFNVSPKLSNSGMPKSKRYAGSILRWFSEHDVAFFKFVVSTDDDVATVISDYVEPLELDPMCVFLMPAASDQRDFI